MIKKNVRDVQILLTFNNSMINTAQAKHLEKSVPNKACQVDLPKIEFNLLGVSPQYLRKDPFGEDFNSRIDCERNLVV